MAKIRQTEEAANSGKLGGGPELKTLIEQSLAKQPFPKKKGTAITTEERLL